MHHTINAYIQCVPNKRVAKEREREEIKVKKMVGRTTEVKRSFQGNESSLCVRQTDIYWF